MKYKSLYILSFLLPLFVLFSCAGGDGKVIDEGMIEYDAKVMDMSHPMATMVPTQMTCRFKGNKCALEMSAVAGLFNSTFISDPDAKTLTQIVKLMNKKFCLVQTLEDIEAENKEYPLILTTTKETKMIAGYKCYKVHVKVDNETQEEFDVFYTKEIQIKDVNFASPYSLLDGVLLEYQIKKNGIEIRFTAKSVSKAEIEDDIFLLNKEYKHISKTEMDQIFEGNF